MTETATAARAIRAHQAQTTGTTAYHIFGIIPHVVCTDGALCVAKEAKAFWLLDAIASYITNKQVGADSFTVWDLVEDSEDGVVLKGTDGNGNEYVRQDIGYSSFPRELLPFTLWMEHGTIGPDRSGWVILLPEEH